MEYIYSTIKRVMALALIVGALPFVFFARAYAEEMPEISDQKTASKWMDDPKKPVGFTYGVEAKLQTTYIWRGLYSGGANIQLDANVGYGGLFFDMWWNIGVTDWSFSKFLPELDFSLGFNRYGLKLYMLYVHHFDFAFFNMTNTPGSGNRLELNARYTISSKIPLTFVWATRLWGNDGYFDENGVYKRAYSSYAEINYTQALPYDLSLYGAIGISPWRSVYSGYKQRFSVNNIEVRLRKDWSASEHCGIALQGQLTVNPSAIADDKTTAEWHPKDPNNQAINANISMIVYLK